MKKEDRVKSVCLDKKDQNHPLAKFIIWRKAHHKPSKGIRKKDKYYE
jgi:hypothetical protein